MAKVIGKTDDGKDIYGLDFDISVKEVKETGDGRRIFSMIGSTPSVDRDGDTISPKGWVTKYYKKNSVVQWAHDHKIPAIARVNKFSVNDAALMFDELEFPKKGVHPFADMIASLMEDGFIKAGSVGFMPIKSEKREMTDKEKDNEPDYFCQPVKFIKQELLEYSVCNVGSNRDALVTHLGQKGFKTTGKVKIEGHEFEMKQLIDALFVEENDAQGDVSIDDDEETVITLAKEKRVIPFKHYALDPEDAVWSGPTERAAAEISDLKVISTWVDPEKDDVKGGYKLPHHRASNHNTVWNGVRAAMAALLGARGGIDIPDNDRSGVYNHLKSHYLEFDKEVPELKEYTGAELKELFPSLHESGMFKYEDYEIDWGDEKEDDEKKDKPVSKYCEILRDSESGELFLQLKESFKELHGQEIRVSWKSDQTERCFEANLQAYNEDENKWFDVETIVIQDIEEKAGAVLSKTNKGKLKQAQSLIGDVLAASEPVEAVTENESDIKSQLPDKGLKEILDRLTLMEKAIDTFAVSNKEKEDTIEDDKEFEIDIEETPIEEKEFDLDDLEENKEEEEIDLKDVARVIGDAIKPMAKEIIRSELRKVTGKID